MNSTKVPHPLYRDPIQDGAADPTVIWNRAERSWWIVYTNRRAAAPRQPGVAWVHGTDLGVASSRDGGVTWVYRGTLTGLDTEWGRHTYWAPEIVDDGSAYHMFVSVEQGVPAFWIGDKRVIRHYTSPNLIEWTYRSDLPLPTDNAIDPCVFPRPDGGWRLWYKNESDDQHTWYCDSTNLFEWTACGPAVISSRHEGPNVFRLQGAYWMLVDEWRGLRVLTSVDLVTWIPHGLILDVPGTLEDDGAIGQHADVIVHGDEATIVYFTHPDRPFGADFDDTDPQHRRSSLQAARLQVVAGTLQCDRDAVMDGPLLPTAGLAEALT